MVDWNAYRADWPYLAEGSLWLQHAGITPLNLRVMRSATRYMEEFAKSPGPTYRRLWHAATDGARDKVAAFLGTTSDRLALVKNTSQGIILVAEGLSLPAGANVVTLTGEFPSNRLPWRNLERRGVEVRTVPADAHGHCDTDAVAAAMDAGTAVLAVSWVQYIDGYRQDLASLAELCQRWGAFLVVDAIQGAGALPLFLDGLDAVIAGGHKWLCGTEGAGFLYLSPRLLDALTPCNVSWGSVGDWIFRAGEELLAEESLPPLKPTAERFEEGTPNVWGQIMLGEAVDMLSEIGLPTIWQRIVAVQDHFIEAARAKGYRIDSSLLPSQRSGIMALAHERHTPAEIVRALATDNITAIQRGQAVRIAAHFYINESDMDRVVAALP
ncbi:MAG: aminotransferase class V-fold PLP-dependent enzyme [Armatimonadetes bacterium]|nr:aminotransferase class V-fold PLP-dependent enzyme [Armatimonadota bacterium]